jgi:uncharacterized protein (TIGR01777 family)
MGERMKIVVTGSGGLIGRSLVKTLVGDGHDVTRLVRRTPRAPDEVEWDPAGGKIDAAGLEGVDAAIHLAAAGIGDRRWTDAYKQEILDSRVNGTNLLASTLAELDPKPSVMVSASAIGWYGDRGDEILDETASPGTGFLADVAAAWEEATEPAEAAGIRVVHPRSGIVLARDSLTLRRLLLPVKLAVAGKMGSGDQWWSWITLEDEVRALIHLAVASDLAGPVNLTAPNPVTNEEFISTLGQVLGRPTILPTPSFALKAILGSELADTLVLQSDRVVPVRLEADGFEFESPVLIDALRSVLHTRS